MGTAAAIEGIEGSSYRPTSARHSTCARARPVWLLRQLGAPTLPPTQAIPDSYAKGSLSLRKAGSWPGSSYLHATPKRSPTPEIVPVMRRVQRAKVGGAHRISGRAAADGRATRARPQPPGPLCCDTFLPPDLPRGRFKSRAAVMPLMDIRTRHNKYRHVRIDWPNRAWRISMQAHVALGAWARRNSPYSCNHEGRCCCCHEK